MCVFLTSLSFSLLCRIIIIHSFIKKRTPPPHPHQNNFLNERKILPFSSRTRTSIKAPLDMSPSTLSRGHIDKSLRATESYSCVFRESFQLWVLIFSWRGENRHTLLVFNPTLTSLNHSVVCCCHPDLHLPISSRPAMPKEVDVQPPPTSPVPHLIYNLKFALSDCLWFLTASTKKTKNKKPLLEKVTCLSSSQSLRESAEYIEKLVVLQGVVLLLPWPGLNVRALLSGQHM